MAKVNNKKKLKNKSKNNLTLFLRRGNIQPSEGFLDKK